MRTIKKQQPPPSLQQWRAQNHDKPNYGYGLLRQDKVVTEEVQSQLLKEQGYLCAYSGVRIEAYSSHIEHLFPQEHCGKDAETDYQNIVVCYPAPNTPRCQYGAHPKDNWPNLAQQHLFLSPLHLACEERFVFDRSGGMKEKDKTDEPAIETIKKLCLADKTLISQRREAIAATLGLIEKTKKHSLSKAKKLLEKYESVGRDVNDGEDVHLPPFVFALEQVLRKYIKKIETIRRSRQCHPANP